MIDIVKEEIYVKINKDMEGQTSNKISQRIE